MEFQTRTRGESGRLLRSHLGLLGALTALFALVALFASSAAVADQTGCPEGNPNTKPVSNLVGIGSSPVITEEGKKAEYTFTSVNAGGVAGQGIPGLIEYCVYYPEGADPAVDVNAVPGGAEGYNGTFFADPPSPTKEKYESFGFQRNNGGGNESNIPLDGTTRVMGWGTWSGGAPSGQVIVLHINDKAECDALYDPDPAEGTCFVLPGEP
jgi:hypothetical protein